MHFYAFFNHFYCALLSLYCSWANPHNLDYVSLLVDLRSFSYWAPSLPKRRFTQERRAIERFQRAMRPALKSILLSSNYTRHFVIKKNANFINLPVPVAHFLYRACNIFQHQAISHKMVAQWLKGSGPAVQLVRVTNVGSRALRAWVSCCVVQPAAVLVK